MSKNRSLLYRRLSFSLLFLVTCLAFLLVAPQLSTAETPSTPEEILKQAWQNATSSGRYDYRTQIGQTAYPLPTLSNSGRPPTENHVAMAGSVDLRSETMDLTLWRHGGFDPNQGVQIKVENGRAYSRHGENGAWEEIDNVTGLFAPAGDPLAFLAGMQNVTVGEAQTFTFGEKGDQQYTQYLFDINGPAFSLYVRDQMEIQLAKEGQLPPGMGLEASEIYRDMSGRGEIWLDHNQLPTRIELGLNLPPQGNDGPVKAEITTDLSNFDLEQISVASTTFLGDAQTWLRYNLPTAAQSQQIAFNSLTVLLLACVLLFVARYWRHPKFYNTVVVTIIGSMVFSPLLSSRTLHAYYVEQQSEHNTRIEEAAVAEQKQEILDSHQTSDWHPHLSAIDQYMPQQPKADVASLLATTSDTESLVDTDGDGLSDVAEAEYFTCDGTTITGDCEGVVDPTDTDGDGLSDGLEVNQLGTSPIRNDTDQDGILDPIEIQGFAYNANMTWYSDPTDADSNRDGLVDGVECPVWNIALTNDYDTAANCPDSDGDNIPDLFDEDNDGDGVSDQADASPFAVSSQTFTRTTPFNLTVDNLALGEPVYVDIEMRPTNPDNLTLYRHVLDWPTGDTAGQVQRRLDTTWRTTHNAEIWNNAPNAYNGDVRLMPVLEITLPYTNNHYSNLPLLTGSPANRSLANGVDSWLDEEILDPFGIAIREADDGTLTAIVPLALVTNRDSEFPEAFAARMVYWPEQGTAGRVDWGEAHQFRLAWMVEMISDECVNPEADPETCKRQDVRSMIHTYYDDWKLTGLSVSEELDLEAAIIYEDPEFDTNLGSDDQLLIASLNLSNTFLRGRDCATTTNGVCDIDGVRDVNMSNLETTVPTWFTSTSYIEVKTYSYDHSAQLGEMVSTRAKTILSNNFLGYVDETIPILMYAHEAENREINLNDLAAVNGDSLTIDFDPATILPVRRAGLSWMAYQRNSGSWEAYEPTSYMTSLEDRFAELPFFQPENNSDQSLAEAEMRNVFAQYYYAVLFQGVVAVMEVNGQNVWTQAEGDVPETDYDPLFAAGTTNGIVTVSLWVLNPITRRIQPSWMNWSDPTQIEVSEVQYELFGRVNPLTVSIFLAAAAGISLLAIGYFTNNQKLFRIGEIIMASITIVVAMITIITFISVMIQTLAQASAITASLVFKVAKVFRFSGAFGTIISILIIWGMAISQIVQADDAVGRSVLIAYAIVQTLMVLFLYIASYLGFGIIFFVLLLVDAILLLIGVRSINERAIEFFANKLYNVNMVINNIDSGKRLDIGIDEIAFGDPELGFTTDNTLEVTVSISNVARIDGDVSTSQAKNRAAFSYHLDNAPIDYHQSLNEGDSQADWVPITRTYQFYGTEIEYVQKLGIYKTFTATRSLEQQDGINRTLDFYLNEAYLVSYKGCWMRPHAVIPNNCDWGQVRNTSHIRLDESIIFDIMPGTVYEFSRMNWASGAGFGGASQVDLDNDGLNDHDGTDPNRLFYDSDGDLVSDYYEVSNGLNPHQADSDGDGLLDRDELRYRTNPLAADTDGDGLNDKLEAVDGWLINYTDDSGTLKELRVWSNPRVINADEDAFDDYLEFSLGLHPNVPTDPSVIANFVQIEDLDVAEVIDGEPVSFFEFEEGAYDLIFSDSMDSAHTAVCRSGSGQCPATGTAGRFGAGLTFDGTSDMITTTIPFSTTSVGDFTVGMWINYDIDASTSGWKNLVRQQLGSANGPAILGLQSGGFVYTDLNGGETIDGIAITPGRWHHVAVVWNGVDTVDLYLDGVKDAGTAKNLVGAPGWNDSDVIEIGALVNSSGTQIWQFPGQMDELVFYDYALTDTEIGTLMEGFIPRNDLIVAPGAELVYQGAVTNTRTTQGVDGYLYGVSEYLTPTVATPAVYIPFETEDMVTTFADTLTGGRYGATCVEDGSCPDFSDLGQITNGVEFNGSTDVLTIPNLSRGQTGPFFDSDEEQTIAFWIHPISRPDAGLYEAILDTDETASSVRPKGAVDISLDSTGRLVLDIGGSIETYRTCSGGSCTTINSGADLATHVSGAALSDNSWHHVTIVYRGPSFFTGGEGETEIYINGVRDSEADYYEATSPAELYVGPGRLGSNMAGDSFLHGRLDELVFYNEDVVDTSDMVSIMAGTYEVGGNVDPAAIIKFEETALTRQVGVVNQMVGAEQAFCTGAGCPTVSTSGVFSDALMLDGSDDALTLNHVLNPADLSFTAMAWVQPTSSGGIILEQTDGSGTGRTWLGLQGGNQLFANLGTTTIQSSASLPNNSWSHVAFSYNGITGTLYLDGAMVGQAAVSAEASDGDMMIGSSKTGSNFFAGLIDDLLIIPAATEQEGIVSLMNHSYPAISVAEPFVAFEIEPNPPSSADYYGALSIQDNESFLGVVNEPAIPCSGLACPEIVSSSGISGSLRFDGLDDWLDIGSFSFVNGSVVHFWMRVDGAPADNDTILAYIDDSTGNHGVSVELTSAGVIQYSYSETGVSGTPIVGSINVADGEWHHITLAGPSTSDGHTTYQTTLYVDGQLEGSQSYNSVPFDMGDSLIIGRWNGTQTTSYFAGEIDELMLTRLSLNDVFGAVGAARLAADYPNLPVIRTVLAENAIVVTGTAQVSDLAGNGFHRFEETVEAALQLQQQISQPFVDNNAADLVTFGSFEEVPNANLFENLVSTEEDFTCEEGECPFSGLRGAVGRALLFDGIDDHLTGPDFIPGHFTVAAWVKADRGTIIDLNRGTTTLDFFGLTVGDERLPFTLPENEWVHVVASFDRTTGAVAVYGNGQLLNSDTFAAGAIGGRDHIIGANRFLGNVLNGYLDDLRIYDIPLSAADSLELYETSAAVLRFEFDEDTGATSFADRSANQFVGVPTSGSFFSEVLSETVTYYNPAAGTDGQIGNTALFVNTNGGLTVHPADDSALDLADDVSMMMWVRPETTGADQNRLLLTKGTADGSNHNYRLELVANSYNLRFSAQGNSCSSDVVNITSTAELLDGVWNFVAVTYDGTNAAIYINGQLDNTASASGLLCQNNEPVRMGLNFVGEMDEAAVYGRALTASELQSIFLRELRWYRARAIQEIQVDNEAPTIELLSDASYRPNGYIQLAVSAVDIYSEITLFEMGIQGPSDSDFVWRGAVTCSDNQNGAAWCPAFDTTELDGAGTYSITFRAVDVAGNETISSVYHIYADGTGPSISANGFNGEWRDLLVGNAETLSYTLPISLTITDPQLPDGPAGSGVVTDSVTIALYDTGSGELYGNGAVQYLTHQGADLYTVNYEIEGIVPNGLFTATVYAEDLVGNEITTAVLTNSRAPAPSGTIQLDARASTADVPPELIPDDTVTGTFTLNGTVSELASFGGEVAIFHFEQISGTDTFPDSSVYGNHASCDLGGCPLQQSDIGNIYAGPEFGQYIKLFPEPLYIEPMFNPISDTFTVSLWFAVDSLAASVNRPIFTIHAGDGISETVLAINSSGRLATQLGGVETADATNNLVEFQWYHAAVSYDGTTVQLYLDGVLVAQADVAAQYANGQIQLGSDTYRDLVDELSIYEEVLTGREIYALSQAGGRGVSSVEVGFEWVDLATISQTDGITADEWFWATVNGSGGAFSTWQFVDNDATREGFYAVHSRSTDVAGNQSPPHTVWNGLIDRVPPRITAVAAHIIDNGAPKTSYSFTINDFMLDESTLVHVCSAGDLTISRYPSIGLVYDNVPYQISGLCLLDGHGYSAIDATICDLAGHCTTETTTVMQSAEELAIVEPADGSSIVDSVATVNIPINGTAYDPDGVTEISVYINDIHYGTDGIAGSPLFSSWSVSDWQPTTSGSYTVTAVLTNSLNVTRTENVNISVTLGICEAEYTGDSTTDFTSNDAGALRQAVAAVPAGGTVKVAGFCFGAAGNGSITQTVSIDKAVTLAGGYEPGGDWSSAEPDLYETRLDAQGDGRVVTIVNAGNVTIQDLSLTGGYAVAPGGYSNQANHGGGLYIDNSTVTLENVVVRDNFAERYSSGIYVRTAGSTLTINNSAIISNTIDGLTDRRGGGIMVHTNTALTLTNSTIAYNESQGGGGIYASGGTTVYIEDSTISHNQSVSVDGGGMYFGGSLLTVVNSTFSHNEAASTKTAAILAGGNANISFSTIVSNTGAHGLKSGGSLTLTNSVIAYHSLDCNAAIAVDGGYNLSSDDSCGLTAGTSITNTDPLLGPLADNFGETQSHLPAQNSPLLDQIPNGVNGCGTTVTTDQRAISRTDHLPCDIGSVELPQNPLSPPVPQININGVNVDLSWSSASVQCEYDLLTSNMPYDGYGLLVADLDSLSYVVPNGVENGNAYYYVRANCSNGTVESSAVGLFNFDLTGGND